MIPPFGNAPASVSTNLPPTLSFAQCMIAGGTYIIKHHVTLPADINPSAPPDDLPIRFKSHPVRAFATFPTRDNLGRGSSTKAADGQIHPWKGR